MTVSPAITHPRQTISFGISAAALGSVGAALFFLPILGIAIAAAGLSMGVVGVVRGRRAGVSEFRWSVIGCLVCLSAIMAGLIIAYAPIGELPGRAVPTEFRQTPHRPYVAPPARPS